MSYLVYRQPQAATPNGNLVLGDWLEVPDVDTVPLFTAATTKFIDLVPEDLTANYGRKALITLELAEIVLAFGRNVANTDKLFIPPGGNIELEVGKQRVSATVLTGTIEAAVQVWVAKYSKVV